MKRKEGPAVRDTFIWIAVLIGVGYIAYCFWGTWWAIPAFFVYGAFYASPGDSRWHECGHGTAFKTFWMNDTIYQVIPDVDSARQFCSTLLSDNVSVFRDSDLNEDESTETTLDVKAVSHSFYMVHDGAGLQIVYL